MAATVQNPTQAIKVCIVGAGVSGLRASGRLAAMGFDVTILEARDRVGGRVHQSFAFDQPVDLGPSWIHGTQGNPLVSLADKAGIPVMACNAVYSICDSSGSWLPRSMARALYKEVWEILELAIMKSRKEWALLQDSEKLMDFVRQQAGTREPKIPDMDSVAYRSLILQIVEMWGAFMGDDCENQSLKNLWLDAGLEGDNLFMLSTYSAVVKDLVKSIGHTAKLRLDSEVIKIQYHNEQVIVETTDGFRDFFDSVIVTTPLGWLKRNLNTFRPPVSPWISKAIQSLGYGNLDRVFVRFPRAFWNDCHNTTNCRDPNFPIESLFLSPDYASETNSAKWRVEIISLSGLPYPYAQPIIMFFVYGQFGRHITGLVRGMSQNSEEYYAVLDKQFRPYYSKLPNYNRSSFDCSPSDFTSTDWQGDKFAGYGSYCNLPVDSGDCAQHIEILREGMAERGIWFAGEHVSPLGGLGTVAGAYWSGEEAARSVAEYHNISLNV